MSLFHGIRPPTADNEDGWINEWYAQARVPLDRLPFTAEWEALYSLWRVRWGGRTPHRHRLWIKLVTLRKQHRLVTLGSYKHEPTVGDNEGGGRRWPKIRKGS